MTLPRRRRLRAVATFAMLVLTASCSLFVSLDGLEGGSDAGAADGAVDVASDVSSSDGSIAVDAGDAGDAGPKCDPTAPFEETHLLVSGADDGLALFKVTLVATEDEGWVTVDDPADAAYPASILHGNLFPDGGYTTSDTLQNAVDPAVTADGTVLIYAANGSVGSFDLFRSTRTGTGPFNAGVQMDNVQSSKSDVSPFVDRAGGLWFASDRDETNFKLDIFHANPVPGGGFEAPVRRTELDSNGSTSGIVLTSDLLTAYVSSDRTDLPHVGGGDIFRATRTSPSEAFGALTVVTELSSTSNERASWISTDNCRLYFESDKDFGIDEIYEATKTPK